MENAAAAALVLAGLAACAGYTQGTTGLSDSGLPIVNGSSDAGDGGHDGGDAGPDAGFDAGCTPLSLNTVGIIDNCFGNNFLSTGSVSVNSASCTVQINSALTVCNGTVSGASDAFDGGCGGYVCSSRSLPGAIVCPTSASSSCTITVCDGGC